MTSKTIEPVTETMIAEMEEIFKLFDKDNDGLVANTEFGTMIRALNMNPSEEEVKKLVEDADPEHTGSFSRDAFFTVATKRGKDNDTYEDLIEAFRTLVTNPDKKTTAVYPVSETWFKSAMGQYGEPMQKAEVEEVLADLNVLYKNEDNQSMVNCEEFAKLLMSK